ncbi:hypothetical protein [Acidithiobacillus sp.]|jgi:hypothetical protein|uniref:hypothetical protein n=1 Tax=Acidithiobacillus sp. TaxID=1872118 RepID=UPI0025C70609|nr:hypothetical protein [Acidithiobacillus sp.]MCK9189219.1 hypothetical protein [Acidithiobacillus sp.]MCK9359461.1 hypothetical protein [Acidithiobacillus sp.]
MNDTIRQLRITHLQNYRHILLLLRGTHIAAIDMDLNVVRSELQALYMNADGCSLFCALMISSRVERIEQRLALAD